MSTTVDPGLDLERLRRAYQRDAMAYSRTLTEDNLMESTAQGTQRAITLESFRAIRVHRPDIQCFNELLIQYPRPGERPEKPGRVVPDNMIVVHPESIENIGSYMMPIMKIRPTLVMEYVSDANTRKDYESSYDKYEEFVQAPYYLVFDPDESKLDVFCLVRDRYERLNPSAEGRFLIPELELEVGLLDGWVRYWFRGELVPLVPEREEHLLEERHQRTLAQLERDAAMREREAAMRERDAAMTRAAALESELAALRAQLNTPPSENR